MMVTSAILEVARLVRVRAGLSQEALASACGCATLTVWRHETGMRRMTVVDLAERLQVCGVDTAGFASALLGVARGDRAPRRFSVSW